MLPAAPVQKLSTSLNNIDLIDKITVADIVEFVDRIYKNISVDSHIYGNISPNEVKTLYDVVFAELDIDESPDTAQAYKVFSIPTVIIMWDGAEMGRVVGNQQKSKLVEFIDQCLTS